MVNCSRGWFVGAIAALVIAVLVPEVVVGTGAGEKVLVVGFDGMDPRLTKKLMEEGKLPNFQRLADRGGLYPLVTSIPPQSPVAWSNFITGQNPGGHGIFDFIARKPETYVPYLSTSETDEKGTHLLRRGTAFWEILEDHDIPCSVLKLPSNYPPVDMNGPSLSGMGTPDILGTYGKTSIFTTEPPVDEDVGGGGQVFVVKMRDYSFDASLVGPAFGEGSDAQRFEAGFTVWVDPDEAVAKFRLGDEEWVMKEGEWSAWKPVELTVAMPWWQKLLAYTSGEYPLRVIARFYLRQVRPEFTLYVSPLNFDPLHPPSSTRICTPADYSKKLAKSIGPFYTQGMAEDTWALDEGYLTDQEFLQQSDLVLQERIRMFEYELDRFDEGLYFCYFSTTDPLSHMFGRFMDKAHPLYSEEEFEKYGHVIPWTYTRMDTILGCALDQVGAETTVMVLSDHGFTSYRRFFHLNTWLYQNGYLELRDKRKNMSGEFFANVNMRRTQAYALGINCLYLNLKDREGYGSVKPGYQAEKLMDELVEKLEAVVDPETGLHPIKKVYRGSEVYAGACMEDAPDLIIGYDTGYRASWETALGAVPEGELFGDNLKKWSGDHCMAREVIPGTLVTSKPVQVDQPALVDLAPTILNEFGIAKTPEMIGRNLFGSSPRVAAR